MNVFMCSIDAFLQGAEGCRVSSHCPLLLLHSPVSGSAICRPGNFDSCGYKCCVCFFSTTESGWGTSSLGLSVPSRLEGECEARNI